jgi:hypothetical protein
VSSPTLGPNSPKAPRIVPAARIATAFGPVRGRGHQVQLTARVGPQEAGGLDVEQLPAPFGQLREQVDDVEVVEQAVD